MDYFREHVTFDFKCFSLNVETAGECVVKRNGFVWADNSAIGRFKRGLLTPLTFARHRLSPLAAFTSGAYFMPQWKAVTVNLRIYTAKIKGIFGGP